MQEQQITKGAALIKKGELVAFPTETIYGLGANALNAKAAEKIYKAKGRPSDNPLIVHVSNQAMLKKIVKKIPRKAQLLMDAFWPGPLTIIFKKNECIPDVVNRMGRVAVRMPNHHIALALIEKSGVPIAAPSANKSGKPSPTSAAHVREDFPNLFIIDGGRTKHGLESTVVEVDKNVKVYRLGAISFEQICKVVPDAILVGKSVKNVISPGMKYRHYAPKQPLLVFKNKESLKKYARQHQGAIVLCGHKQLQNFKGFQCIDLGNSNEEIAHNLFNAFRTKKGTALLFLAIPKRGIGRTIMDRVERASGAS